jgi:hypothetical protein
MRTWGIEPIALKPVGNGICEMVANVISSRNLLPDEEKNDACVLIEAAFCGALFLITWDGHLLDAPNDLLNSALGDFDLPRVQIAHPRVLLGY